MAEISKLPNLSGQTLNLRPVTAEHAPQLFPIMGDADLMRYVLPPAKTIEAAATTLAEMSAVSPQWAGWWLIERREDRAAMGLMMYYGVHYYNRYASIAYLVHHQYQRRGVATQALRLAISFLFDELQVNRIEAEIESENSRSSSLLKKVGFVCEAKCLRQRLYLNDEFRNVEMHALLKNAS